MAIPEARPDTTLRLERKLAAPPERVFAAWTTPEALIRWFGPGDQYTCTVLAMDVRPGGEYRFQMRHSGGNAHEVFGTYREVQPPSRLSFTWAWAANPERGVTDVTVELHAEGAGTRLLLTHERFPNTEVRDAHAAGWTPGLDKMVAMFAPALPRA